MGFIHGVDGTSRYTCVQSFFDSTNSDLTVIEAERKVVGQKLMIAVGCWCWSFYVGWDLDPFEKVLSFSAHRPIIRRGGLMGGCLHSRTR